MPLFTIGKKKILFIHVPKTGGVAISKWLSKKGEVAFSALDYPSTFRCNPQHFTMSDMLFIFGNPTWDEAFSIVRNPYDRVKSEFLWRYPVTIRHGGLRPDFAAWLEVSLEITSKDKHHLDNHMRPQTDFIDDGLTVFRYEDGFERISEYVSNICGIENDFDHSEIINRSDRSGDFKLRWSSVRLVDTFYASDFECLGYAPRSVETLSGLGDSVVSYPGKGSGV